MSDLFTPNQIEGLVIIGLVLLVFIALFVDGGRETPKK